MNNIDTLLKQFRILGFPQETARVYLEILKAPTTHLQLARLTGINRSKVYRIVDHLSKHNLVYSMSDDRGTFIAAAELSIIETELARDEAKVKEKRRVFDSLVTELELFKVTQSNDFTINNYKGEKGFKQMMWHELKADGEILMFGRGSLEDFVTGKRWIAEQRGRMLTTDYRIRQLINQADDRNVFSVDTDRYAYRIIDDNLLTLSNQVITYNETVALYCWRQPEKVGIEIVNSSYAMMMRQIFEHYWQVAHAN